MWTELDKGNADTLAGCLRDTVALSTLPALWSGAEPNRIAESLAAALCTTLGAKFIYVAIKSGEEENSFHAVAQTDRYEASSSLAEEIGPRLFEWAKTHDPDELLSLPNPLGQGVLRVTTRSLGYCAELGIIAAGFPDTPSPANHLVLNIAATQATTGVKNAMLYGSLRQSEGRFRALIDASTQIVWTAAQDGTIREDSPSWREFTGQTYEQWIAGRWKDAIHPEDCDRVIQLWRRSIEQSTAIFNRVPIATH